MNLLIDTHVFLWMYDEHEKLSKTAKTLLTDFENDLFLSTVSIWEIQIKFKSGKLRLDDPIEVMLDEQMQANNMIILDVKRSHAVNIINLPTFHKDPFDRMLISQAMIEDLSVMTADPQFADYNAKVVW